VFANIEYPFYLCSCNSLTGVLAFTGQDSYFFVFNMKKEIIYLTAEGYKKLKDELDHMRSVERPAISAAIAEARDKGDLSENA